NLHDCSPDPKSGASTNFATWASRGIFLTLRFWVGKVCAGRKSILCHFFLRKFAQKVLCLAILGVIKNCFPFFILKIIAGAVQKQFSETSITPSFSGQNKRRIA